MNQVPVPPKSYPREGGAPVSEANLQSQGPADFYPPLCLKTHWDPTAILKRTLPQGYAAQPLDPRPWTRICMEYTNSSPEEPAPEVNPNLVLPSGGQFYPPGRYQEAIDRESQLRRLDRPLGTCEADQYEPNPRGDMFNAQVLVPKTSVPSDPARIREVSMPRVLLRPGGPAAYQCRAEADDRNLLRSNEFLFNNSTKQDRYKAMGKPARPSS